MWNKLLFYRDTIENKLSLIITALIIFFFLPAFVLGFLFFQKGNVLFLIVGIVLLFLGGFSSFATLKIVGLPLVEVKFLPESEEIKRGNPLKLKVNIKANKDLTVKEIKVLLVCKGLINKGSDFVLMSKSCDFNEEFSLKEDAEKEIEACFKVPEEFKFDRMDKMVLKEQFKGDKNLPVALATILDSKENLVKAPVSAREGIVWEAAVLISFANSKNIFKTEHELEVQA